MLALGASTLGRIQSGNCNWPVQESCCPIQSIPVECGSAWCEWNWIDWDATRYELHHDQDEGAYAYEPDTQINNDQCLWQEGLCNPVTLTCYFGDTQPMLCSTDEMIVGLERCP
jgi:hypothetical protein